MFKKALGTKNSSNKVRHAAELPQLVTTDSAGRAATQLGDQILNARRSIVVRTALRTSNSRWEVLGAIVI